MQNARQPSTPESLRSPGMRDLLPDAMRRFYRLSQQFRETCLSWGYEEIRTPTVEYLHLFTGAGALPPQMLSRVYSFLDWDGWSGERVVLRPDATIPAARLYSEHMRERRTAKLFYVQNVFRFTPGDQPRELWQCGIELIGEGQPAGDVELILLTRQVLEGLGAGRVKIQLSHPGILQAVLARAGLSPQERERLYDSILEGDTSGLTALEEMAPELRIPLRLLLNAEDSGREYLKKLEGVLAQTVPEARQPIAELSAIAETLQEVGCEYDVGLSAIGPFEYYTGVAFQFRIDGQKVGGGGRYDHLIETVGGVSAPATGCGLDIETLLPLLPAEQSRRHAITVRYEGQRGLVEALGIAQGLREAGLAASVASNVGAGPELWVDGTRYVIRDEEIREFPSLDEAIAYLRSSASD